MPNVSQSDHHNPPDQHRRPYHHHAHHLPHTLWPAVFAIVVNLVVLCIIPLDNGHVAPLAMCLFSEVQYADPVKMHHHSDTIINNMRHELRSFPIVNINLLP